MTENLQCYDCSEVSQSDHVEKFNNGWTCPSCKYFNNDSTISDNKVSSSNEEVPDEISRMIGIITLFLIIKVITTVSWFIVGIGIFLSGFLGLSEYVYVRYMLPENSKVAYRNRRKKNINHRTAEFLSVLFMCGIIVGIFLFFETILYA